MIYFITKYALTTGIEMIPGEYVEELKDPDMLRIKLPGDSFASYAHKEGRDWHRTHEEALVRAEAMRKAKIDSLKKAIVKMEKLNFKEPK